MISWDENKRAANLMKHGIDLADCSVIFDSALVTNEDTREAYGEQRLRSFGLFYGIVVLMVWVDRPEGPRLISVRKAKRDEANRYWKTLGNRP